MRRGGRRLINGGSGALVAPPRRAVRAAGQGAAGPRWPAGSRLFQALHVTRLDVFTHVRAHECAHAASAVAALVHGQGKQG